jgi:hypothetical protein
MLGPHAPQRQPGIQPGTTHLVEVENQVQLAHVAEELIQHLNEEMNRLEICELVVRRVDARTEEKTRISPVYNFRTSPELNKVRLVFLISRGD